MRVPRGRAHAVLLCLLSSGLLPPAARAGVLAPSLGPLSPAPLQVSPGAPTVNEREDTLDYPVTFTNATAQAIPGPIHVEVDCGNNCGPPENHTIFTAFEPSATPPQRYFTTLPTGLAPGQSVTKFFRLRPLAAPIFTPFVETIGPVDPATAPAPQNASQPPRSFVSGPSSSLRILAVAGQEYVWDVEATNPNGGTLAFALGPIPSPPPELAGASAVDGASLEPVTGVFRWTPPAPGLYAARIAISDGVANATGSFDLVLQVESEATAPAALACADYLAPVTQPGGEVPLLYTRLPWSSFLAGGGEPNVRTGVERRAACTPEVGETVGEGSRSVTCQTTDALWPPASCTFQANVYPTYPIVIGEPRDFVNLRVLPSGCPDVGGFLSSVACTGGSDITVRNTGLGIARDVRLVFPIPANANDEAIAVTTGPEVVCQRLEDASGVRMECDLGDIPGGADGFVSFGLVHAALDPTPGAPPRVLSQLFDPVTVSVTTTTEELTLLDNTATVRGDVALSGDFQPLRVCHAGLFPPGYRDRYDDDMTYGECVAAQSKAFADALAEAECRRNQPRSSFTVLLGDLCGEQPAWMRYVIGGILAVGTLATGAGVIASVVYGTANLSVFTSGIVAAASFPVI
jgi:hypothetical protein